MRARDYLTSETAAKHRERLRSNGWTRTTKTLFGISEEMWVNPVSKRTMLLDRAILSQLRRDSRLRKLARRSRTK